MCGLDQTIRISAEQTIQIKALGAVKMRNEAARKKEHQMMEAVLNKKIVYWFLECLQLGRQKEPTMFREKST